MREIALYVTTESEALIGGLQEALDRDEVIDIKVPGGIYTVQLEAIELDEEDDDA